MKKIKITLFLLTILTINKSISQTTFQGFAIPKSFIYQRMINDIEDNIIDTVKFSVKQYYINDSMQLFLKLDRFFSFCHNNKDIELPFKCNEHAQYYNILIDFKAKKIYTNSASCDTCQDKFFNQILINKYEILDSVVVDEECESIINGYKRNLENTFFEPYIDYTENNLRDKERIPSVKFLGKRFPYLIEKTQTTKTFYAQTKRTMSKEITVDDNLIITEYIFTPIYGDIWQYKYSLISINY